MFYVSSDTLGSSFFHFQTDCSAFCRSSEGTRLCKTYATEVSSIIVYGERVGYVLFGVFSETKITDMYKTKTLPTNKTNFTGMFSATATCYRRHRCAWCVNNTFPPSPDTINRRTCEGPVDRISYSNVIRTDLRN